MSPASSSLPAAPARSRRPRSSATPPRPRLEGTELTEMGLLAEDRRRRVHRRDARHRRCPRHAAGAQLRPHLRPADRPAPEEPALAGNGVMNSGETALRLGLRGNSRGRGSYIMIERDLRLVELTDGRYHAAHISTAALGRRDPPGEGPGPQCHVRYRAALFHLERDGDRRLPDVRQAVAAVAQRSRPGGDRGRASPTARSTPSPAITPRTTRIPSASPSPRPRPASSGWKPCCRCRSRSTTRAG